MFKELLNFAYKRNFKEAIGFYLAHLVLFLLAIFILGTILASASGIEDTKIAYAFGLRMGSVVAIVYCVALASVVVKKKKLFGHFGYILIILLSGAVAIFGGALFGMLPVAYLTTAPIGGKKKPMFVEKEKAVDDSKTR
jgi:hypothetical protein